MASILVVSHYFEPHRGGIEIIAAEVASRLTARGHSVTWAASNVPNNGALPAIDVNRLPMRTADIIADLSGISYPIWSPASMLRLYRAARGADVVHLHDCLYLGNIATALFAWWLRKRVLVTQHIGELPYSNRALRLLMRLANRTIGRLVLNSADACVVYSQVVHDYFSKALRPPGKSRFIPNGVDRAMFYPLTEAERAGLRSSLGWADRQTVCLFAGRFVEKKGLPVVKYLAERFPEQRWVLVGWGLINPVRWNLPNVEVIGTVSHARINQYYQAADLLVLPSVGEGFPLVVQESMACGTPALISEETARAIPGIDRVAFTAEPQGAAMASALQAILGEPGALQDRRAAVAEFAREAWDWERTADQYSEVLTAFMERGARDQLKVASSPEANVSAVLGTEGEHAILRDSHAHPIR